MSAADAVDRGLDAYERQAWGEAYACLAEADGHGRLDPAGFERLAMAAYLTGREDEAHEAWARAHYALLEREEPARAVMCAFWLGISLAQRGDHAQGGGWLARAQRVLDDAGLDTVERGYLMVPAALQALEGGDSEAAGAAFGQVAAIAERFGDADLMAFGQLGRGQARIMAGAAVDGIALLDEAMVGVTSGLASPIVAGIVYCAVIIACQEAFDLRRAQEWTAALSRWCDAQGDLQPYRGQCLVHRSEIMQLRGEWSDALEEAQQACAHMSAAAGDPAVGMALYQQAELLRLRGAFARAEEAYRQASRAGHPVQPGLALLRLAQGRVGDAAAAIRRVAAEAEGHVERARVLAACVRIMLAAGDLDAARESVAELDGLAAGFASPYLDAVVAHARGAVALAAGDPGGAGAELRRARKAWQELDAPYEAARVRLLLARACRALGDHDTADMELDACRRVFADVGAIPDLEQVEELSRRGAARAPGGLTAREAEVLRHVAGGATNREIAGVLVISEKTVARHVSNIFAKLGVSTRAAATAYAYEHDLL